MTKRKKWPLVLKRPIMAVVKVMGMAKGLNSIGARPIQGLFFFIGVVLPYLPIVKYVSTCEGDDIFIWATAYSIVYIFATFALAAFCAKLGKRWKQKEYDELTGDQITFPFLLVLTFYAAIHFLLFYFISLIFVR